MFVVGLIAARTLTLDKEITVSQNLISLPLTDEDVIAVGESLTALETRLAGLLSLQAGERRTLAKMGDQKKGVREH